MQLAVKQLSPGVRVRPCTSAVLQFSVEEMGQLVPLLPHPCSPISSTRWQTEDLDGNKVLFQVRAVRCSSWMETKQLVWLIFEMCDYYIQIDSHVLLEWWNDLKWWTSRSVLEYK